MRSLGLVLAAGIVISAGFIHGAWTNRWRPNAELQQVVSRFAEVPSTWSGWTSEKIKLDPRELKAAGAVGTFSRRYIDSVSGEAVSVFVLAGSPGDIAVHTPDICYPGAGYVLGPIEKTEVEIEGTSQRAKLFTSTATRNRPDSLQRIRLYWAWTVDGSWTAPDDARQTYVSVPVLCKLYLISQENAEESGATSPQRIFLGRFLPHLTDTLYPARRMTE